MCVILFLYQYLGHTPRPEPLHVLKEVLIILIAAIPVGMQTVLTVTLAVGAKQLAQKQVIVKRLTAIEELASVSILCSGMKSLISHFLNRQNGNPYVERADF